MGTVGREIVGGQAEEIIDLLNQGIAAEINDAYRYRVLSVVAEGVHGAPAAELFGRAARDEWEHVGKLLERVNQLGGYPLASPGDAAHRSYAAYRPAPKDPADVETMLRDSLEGERAAIRFYQDLFNRTQQSDPVTAEIARHALIDEIEDEDELERLLTEWPTPKPVAP